MLQKRNNPGAARARPAAFAWDDPLLLDEQLTAGDRLVRDHRQCSLASRITNEGTHDLHAPILGRARTGLQALY
jgi:hypothetical protein